MNVKRKITSIIKNSSYLSDEDDDDIVPTNNSNRQRILSSSSSDDDFSQHDSLEHTENLDRDTTFLARVNLSNTLNFLIQHYGH